MTLVEQGRIALADPISRWIPSSAPGGRRIP
ncbi:hypothetical protein ACSHT2_12270 [Bradyrhizobium sp. PUT101]